MILAVCVCIALQLLTGVGVWLLLMRPLPSVEAPNVSEVKETQAEHVLHCMGHEGTLQFERTMYGDPPETLTHAGRSYRLGAHKRGVWIYRESA